MHYKRKKPRNQPRHPGCSWRWGNAKKEDHSQGLVKRIHGKRGWKEKAYEELEELEMLKVEGLL